MVLGRYSEILLALLVITIVKQGRFQLRFKPGD